MSAIPQQSVEAACIKRQTSFGLITVFLTFFVYNYFFQSLLAALPRIAADLNGMPLFSWGVSIPNLGLAFAMLITGKLSDMYGRRTLLLISLVVCLISTIWCALSSTFVMLIVARTFLCTGLGGLAPLCFSTLGDMFEPVQRSKWIGLLNVPVGIFAFAGPTLGGWFTDNLSWRYIFIFGVPLITACLFMVIFGLSGMKQHAASKIDSRGALLAALASSTMILAFSMAGTIYPWASLQVLGLLAISVILWIIFVKTEAGAKEPILDTQVLRNRVFLTVSSALLLSSFGMTGLMAYYPLMMQGVQNISATSYGMIITLGNVLMNFMGVPAGLILARTKRYKWMLITGYGFTLVSMLVLTFFNASTPFYWGFIAVTLAGIGMGAVPTLNIAVTQYAVPKRLLGMATGSIYFSVMLGQAIAPAILGSAMNIKYNSTFNIIRPAELAQLTDKAALDSLSDSSVLLSESKMTALRETLDKTGHNGQDILDKTVSAIRMSMESGLKVVFIIGAVCMLLTFIIICSIPRNSMDKQVKDEKTL